MDHKLVQQIYPLVEHAEKTIPNLKFEDKESLTADLYLGMAKYMNKEIPKYLARLKRLEDLKEGKEDKYLANIKAQQDLILKESGEKQNNMLTEIYNKWVEETL